MSYDEHLVGLLREALAEEDAISEVAMFGGVAFLLHGHIAVAATSHGGLLVRVGRASVGAALKRAHAEVAVMGGRPMKDWIRVGADGVASSRSVAAWARRGADFVRTLPPKQ
jgi:hypothetical protein